MVLGGGGGGGGEFSYSKKTPLLSQSMKIRPKKLGKICEFSYTQCEF